MKHPLSTVALLSAALMATAAPVLAAPGGHKDSRPIVDCNRGELPRGPRNFALDIAAKLSAAETYVGITSAQQDSWRTYTSALIAFFDRPAPPPGDDAGPVGDPPSPAAPEANQTGEPGKAPPLVSETMADRAIDRAEKAKTLKAAVDGLRATLSPDQLKRLASAEEALRPQPRGPHGPHGDRGGRHGPGARHDGHGPRDNGGPPPPPPGDDTPPAPAEQ